MGALRKVRPHGSSAAIGTPTAEPAPPEPITAGAPTATVALSSAATTSTVVWVDGTSAVVARWAGGPIVERVVSEVPAHHRSTGHIRHDPAVRHGGGGVIAEQVDRDRRLHRADHLRRVAALIPEASDVQVLGPGQARLELAASIRAADGRCGRTRRVETSASGRLTEGQLVARLRETVGQAPARRRVGRA